MKEVEEAVKMRVVEVWKVVVVVGVKAGKEEVLEIVALFC